MSAPNIWGLLLSEVAGRLGERPGFAGGARLPARLYEAIHRDRVPRIRGVAGVNPRKIDAAAEAFSDDSLELLSVHRSWDLSARYAFRLRDGAVVESVLLHHHGLWTVCVSSQAGCPLACSFCATGMLGLRRDLEAWEIVDQVLQVGRDRGVRVSDIVFMGMGEPLLNEDAVYRAAAILHETHGCQISAKRIVISTAGVVPAIHRFVDDRRPFRLVFSLGSADPGKRARLMPIQQRFGFDAFLDAVRRYERHRGGRHVTLEYVAIRNLTMGDDDVEAIRANLTGFNFILNVIPLNPVGNDLVAPTMAEVREWTGRLRPLGIPVKVRYSGGRDQLAGCGQLGRSLLQAAGAGAPTA
jgi:23S rRNA (adenine2503-C2)-methyltransferase